MDGQLAPFLSSPAHATALHGARPLMTLVLCMGVCGLVYFVNSSPMVSMWQPTVTRVHHSLRIPTTRVAGLGLQATPFNAFRGVLAPSSGPQVVSEDPFLSQDEKPSQHLMPSIFLWAVPAVFAVIGWGLGLLWQAKLRSTRSSSLHVMEATPWHAVSIGTDPAQETTVEEESTKKGVQWAGQSTLSSLVNMLINSPLYILMKRGARDTLIRTAEQNGVPWRGEVNAWSQATQRAKAEAAFLQINNPAVEYPSYYTLPFHAYDEGNLGWLPAFECESATYSMALRVWKDEVKQGLLGPLPAQQRLRDGYLDAVAAYRQDMGLTAPLQDILDVGCSVGMSTRYVAKRWPEAMITGLDLSPYMLAIAKCREEEEGGWGTHPITWLHANAERTGLPAASFDFVSLSFVSHELPQAITRSIMEEAYRLLRPGGIFALTDNDPESPVIQGLPPVIFTLMKSTEPWSDEYYTMDMEGTLRAVGFTNVRKATCDPRHRGVLGMKPSSSS